MLRYTVPVAAAAGTLVANALLTCIHCQCPKQVHFSNSTLDVQRLPAAGLQMHPSAPRGLRGQWGSGCCCCCLRSQSRQCQPPAAAAAGSSPLRASATAASYKARRKDQSTLPLQGFTTACTGNCQRGQERDCTGVSAAQTHVKHFAMPWSTACLQALLVTAVAGSSLCDQGHHKNDGQANNITIPLGIYED